MNTDPRSNTVSTPSPVSVPFPERAGNERVALRRPTPADEAAWVALARDERTYAHAPYARPGSDAQAAEGFARTLAHWREHGFGYAVATLPGSDELVGVAGAEVRGEGDESRLNLYYRFAPEVHGRGLGRAAARLVVALTCEYGPDLPLEAVAREHNTVSVATALAAGLDRVGTRRHPGDPADEPSVVLRAPRVERANAFDAAQREEVLDLWCRVNDTGGAVGFTTGAVRERVSAALGRHEAEMASGHVVAALLRAATGELRGLGLLVQGHNPLNDHVRELVRVMTDPEQRGRNLGLVLMAGMHRIAREDGTEIAVLGIRGGTGVEAFYRRCGYTEVGRVPGAIRVAPGDDRDDVTMSRRLDGRRPLDGH